MKSSFVLVLVFGFLFSVVIGACNSLRVRKEISDLTNNEWKRLIEAFAKLHFQRISSERFRNNTFISHGQLIDQKTSMSLYEQLANLHSVRRTEIHNVAVFLGWHRWHLYQMETALQEIDESVTLPYWAWSFDAVSPHLSIVWQHVGSSMYSSILTPMSARCIPGGPFKEWRVRNDCIRRWFSPLNGTSPSGALLPESCIQKIIQNSTKFSDFSERVVVPHNWFHLWTGGSMATLEEAANDPLFYIHHAYVDKLWWDWQKMNQTREGEYNSNDGNEKVSLMDQLPGFQDVSVHDTMKNGALCVLYQEPLKKKARKMNISESTWKWPNEAAMSSVMTWMDMDMESFRNRQAEIRQLCNL